MFVEHNQPRRERFPEGFLEITYSIPTNFNALFCSTMLCLSLFGVFSGFASVLASVSAFESLQAVSSCPWVSLSVVRVLVSFWVVQDQNPNRKALLLRYPLCYPVVYPNQSCL